MKKGIRWTVNKMHMRSFQHLTKIFRQNNGFTLIELLMVVIILGILAAVVIPQFSGSSDDAKVSALKSNLNSIRSAIELYQVQHGGAYPSAGDPNKIDTQLTQYTNVSGVPKTTKDDTYKYGPYLKQGFPKNPFVQDPTKASQIYLAKGITALGTVKANVTGSNGEGWIYVPATGEFIANTDGYDQY
jgi:general secretion pathway protein G